MRVLKFGGTALRDGPAIQHAAGIVRAFGGERPLVVVSAHEGVTSQLDQAIAAARAGRLEWDAIRIRHRTLLRQLDLRSDLLDRHLFDLRALLEALSSGGDEGISFARFRDHVLSFGERMSARVFAAALTHSGVPSTPLDATDLGLVKAAGRGGLPDEAPAALLATLTRVPGVPVVTGFVALDTEGHLTTLGRNGSDLTAAWFGAALAAEEIQFWKRVPGLMTADPRVVPGARPLARMTFADASELARHGARVLHPESLEPARRKRARLSLRNLEDAEAPGSLIADDEADAVAPEAGVKALAHRTGVLSLRLVEEPGGSRARTLAHLFGELEEAGVEPCVGTLATDAVELLFAGDPHTESVLAARFPGARLISGLATASLIGTGLDEDPAVESAFEEAAGLGAREVRTELIGSPGARRSRVLLTTEAAVQGLVQRLHERFFGS